MECAEKRDLPTGPASGRLARWLAAAAVVDAVALGGVLAWRKVVGADIGFHLAYGERLLATGRIVDTDPFLYTDLTPRNPEDIGPANWIDEHGRYRFLNPSYGAEIIFALVHRVAGGVGLTVLQAAMFLAAMALTAATMLRRGVPAALAAAGLLLIAVAASERLIFKPEMFGFVFMAVELLLLTGSQRGRPAAAGLIATHWLFVQVHGSWLLGLALTVPFVVGALARAAWRRWVVRKALDDDLRRRLKWLLIVFAGQTVATLLNPWTWRAPLMPFQLAWFIHVHDIARTGSGHPWALITEMLGPFDPAYAGRVATVALVVILAATVVGAFYSVRLRRGRWLLLLGGMTYIALHLRRNIGPTAFVLVPVALMAIAEALRRARETGLAQRGFAWWRRNWPPGVSGAVISLAGWLRRYWQPGVSAVVILLAAWWSFQAATDRFYRAEGIWRFGAGFSETEMPLAAAGFVAELPREVRVFNNYDTGSNLMYWAGPHGQPREVPIHTNSWAFPPLLTAENLDICQGRRPLAPFAERYGVGAVVLNSAGTTAPLIERLAADPQWVVALIDVKYVVFLRRDGPTAELARQRCLTRGMFDVRAHIERTRGADPEPAVALHAAAMLLMRLGWGNHAIEVWREAVADWPEYPEALNHLGRALGLRGTAHMLQTKAHLEAGREVEAERHRRAALADWSEAERFLTRAIHASGDHSMAQANLDLLRRQRGDFLRGVIRAPQGLKLDNWIDGE